MTSSLSSTSTARSSTCSFPETGGLCILRSVLFLYSSRVESLGFCCGSLMWSCRTGESRGFAFVRYKYADEAQKAVDKLDGVALALILVASVMRVSVCVVENAWIGI